MKVKEIKFGKMPGELNLTGRGVSIFYSALSGETCIRSGKYRNLLDAAVYSINLELVQKLSEGKYIKMFTCCEKETYPFNFDGHDLNETYNKYLTHHRKKGYGYKNNPNPANEIPEFDLFIRSR